MCGLHVDTPELTPRIKTIDMSLLTGLSVYLQKSFLRGPTLTEREWFASFSSTCILVRVYGKMLYIPTCSIRSTSPILWYLHDVPTKYHGIYVWFNTENSSMDLCELVQWIPMDTPKSGDRTKTHSFWWPNNVISRYPSFWDKPIWYVYNTYIHIYIYIRIYI